MNLSLEVLIPLCCKRQGIFLKRKAKLWWDKWHLLCSRNRYKSAPYVCSASYSGCWKACPSAPQPKEVLPLILFLNQVIEDLLKGTKHCQLWMALKFLKCDGKCMCWVKSYQTICQCFMQEHIVALVSNNSVHSFKEMEYFLQSCISCSKCSKLLCMQCV